MRKYWIVFKEISYYIQKDMKTQAFNFLATSHQSAISSFYSSLSFFSPKAQIDGGKKHEGNETWTAVYFFRSGFVKRFASLAAVFPPMTLRLLLPTGFIDFIGPHSCSAIGTSYIVQFTVAFGYHLKSQEFCKSRNILCLSSWYKIQHKDFLNSI